MLKPVFISLANASGQHLQSLVFSGGDNKRVIILIHGACMNFTVGICRFIPNLSCLSGKYDFMSVNTRAHDLGYIENNFSNPKGWAWQTIKENIEDVDTVIKYAIEHGYEEIILCGHSWGGLICLDYMQSIGIREDAVSRLVLFSPTVSYQLLLEVNYRDMLVQSLDVANDYLKRDEFNRIIQTVANAAIPFMSAKTIIDFNESKFFFDRVMSEITVPVTFIVGGLEHKKLIEVCTTTSSMRDNRSCYVIKRANHFYMGKEEHVVQAFDNSILGSF